MGKWNSLPVHNSGGYSVIRCKNNAATLRIIFQKKVKAGLVAEVEAYQDLEDCFDEVGLPTSVAPNDCS